VCDCIVWSIVNTVKERAWPISGVVESTSRPYCARVKGHLLTRVISQVATLFNRWKSTVLCTYIGAATSSAVLFLIFKILYENGVPYTILFYSQLAFSAMVLFNAIFLYPELSSPVQKPPPTNKSRSRKSLSSPQSCMSRNTKKNVLVTADSQSMAKSELTEKKEVPLDTHNPCPLTPHLSFKRATCSLLFLWVVSFFTICRFRLIFFLGVFKRFMENLPDSTPEKVSTYTNLFGLIQFAAIILTPLSGILMDSRSTPSRREDCTYLTDPEKAKAIEAGYSEPWYVEKIRDALRLPRMGGELLRYIRITSFTAMLCLLFSIVVLIPSMTAQIVAFMLYVVVRSFSMSCSLSLYVLIFPRTLHGKLIGSTSLISAGVMLLQYPMLRLIDEVFGGNILLTDISLLLLTVVAFGLPLYLWFHARRNFHRTDEHSKTTDVRNEEMHVVCMETVL